MDKRTRKALKASIAKWERNVQAKTLEDSSISADDCALCDLFFANGRCAGCPVFEATGHGACTGTPYEDAVHARRMWRWLKDESGREPFIEAAQREVDFLKSLLPME